MNRDVYIEAGRLAEAGQAFCTVLITATKGSTPRKAGTMMLVRADGSSVGTVGGGSAEVLATREAQEALRDGQARLKKYALEEDADGTPTGSLCGGEIEVFFAPTLSRDVLYLFGGGHVGKATAAIAAEAGYRVEIFDERPEALSRERHPKASALHVGDCVAHARALALGPHDFVVIAHRHDLDLEILKEIFSKGAGYIGVIASRKKAVHFRKELAAAGHSAEAIEKVHMPIGLPIGAQTPEEIAVAIVAQMIEIRGGGKVKSS
jgi:xanthine dehydrogenase accessory factor